LIGSICKECGKQYYPSIYKCRKCGSYNILDKGMPSTGKVLTYTLLREILPGFEDQEPMIIAIIELDNGVKILSQIVDSSIDNIEIDDKVKIVFRKIRSLGSSDQILYGYKFIKV
jgi:uncharacterized OB-fold protein